MYLHSSLALSYVGGGTHISSTSEAKSFALLEERGRGGHKKRVLWSMLICRHWLDASWTTGGISKGVRRIIAATGEAAEIAMKADRPSTPVTLNSVCEPRAVCSRTTS